MTSKVRKAKRKIVPSAAVQAAVAINPGAARVNAVAQAKTMPAASQLPIPLIAGLSWLSLGPSAIPNGQPRVDRVPGKRGPFVTGRVSAIAIPPNDSKTIYLGAASGGIWRTSDGGETWSPLSDFQDTLAIGALAIDPKNPLTVYAGTGEGNSYVYAEFQTPWHPFYGVGALKTVDGGVNWTVKGAAEFAGCSFFRIAINPTGTNVLFAATSRGLFRSLDGGDTWSQMSNGLPQGAAATDVAIDPANPTTVYAGVWDKGLFKSTNADAAEPEWALLVNGLPNDRIGRVALAVAPSNPQTVYAGLAANIARSTDGGTTWDSRQYPNVAVTGYSCHLAVNPTDSKIIYVCGEWLWKINYKGVNPELTQLSEYYTFHTDQHTLTFDPANPLVMYAGNDGGIFRSLDGGTSWSDEINRGLAITQFTFIDQHPTSDSVLFGGTQDNGTEQFRNSPVYYHADDGDGGAVVIDQNTPDRVVHHLEEWDINLSTAGGEFDSWASVDVNRGGPTMAYPPLTLDLSNSMNIAFGSSKIHLDPQQGASNWPNPLPLPALDAAECVSSIYYLDSKTIFAGTTFGKVFRLRGLGVSQWAVDALHAAPLPVGNLVWDIRTLPNDPQTIVAVLSGFGIVHVWRGDIGASGAVNWIDISGTGIGRLPDIPVNALIVESRNAMYIATDIGVFCTTDAGKTWAWFSEGLPRTDISDLRLFTAQGGTIRLLRAASYGRGIWERDLNGASATDPTIFLRDHAMATGRLSTTPTNAAFDEPLQGIVRGQALDWWQCADLKIEIPVRAKPTSVDYVEFEANVRHCALQPGQLHEVYVQVNNRGSRTANNVSLKLLYSDASNGLLDLPPDFWAKYPADSIDLSIWKPIGAAILIPSITPTKPEVVNFPWQAPAGKLDRICFLAVVNCADDPIPAVKKIYDVRQLVTTERRVGLRASQVPV